MAIYKIVYKKLIFLCLVATLSSCTGGKVLDIKSPCVSTKDGPCGPRQPVNDWWLKNNKINS
jgi:hypothetical protein